jgi:hypothetical protein
MDDTNNIQTPSKEPPEAVPPDINQPDPEAERLRAENLELKQKIRMRDARERMIELLEAAEATSPDLLFAAVRNRLQFSDDGELQNAAALVQRLKERFPGYFGRTPAVGTIDAAAGNSETPLTPEMLRNMTPEQIARLDWNDVRAALSRGPLR